MPSYVRPVQKLGGECIYGIPGFTEAWQPLDAGHVGACVKSLAKIKFETWPSQPYTGKVDLGHETLNWEIWELNKFTMREKRIMVSWIYGDAWEDFCGPKYAHFRRAAFERTGLLMTSTGKNDGQFTAEGLEDPYVVANVFGFRICFVNF